MNWWWGTQMNVIDIKETRLNRDLTPSFLRATPWSKQYQLVGHIWPQPLSSPSYGVHPSPTGSRMGLYSRRLEMRGRYDIWVGVGRRRMWNRVHMAIHIWSATFRLFISPFKNNITSNTNLHASARTGRGANHIPTYHWSPRNNKHAQCYLRGRLAYALQCQQTDEHGQRWVVSLPSS